MYFKNDETRSYYFDQALRHAEEIIGRSNDPHQVNLAKRRLARWAREDAKAFRLLNGGS